LNTIAAPDRESALSLFAILNPQISSREYIRYREHLYILQDAIHQWKFSNQPWPIATGFSSPLAYYKNTSYYQYISPENKLLRRLMKCELLEIMLLQTKNFDQTIKRFQLRHRKVDYENGDDEYITGFPPDAILLYMSKQSLLRAALLLRVEEIDTGGDPSKMPTSLAEIFAKNNNMPPLDYMDESVEVQVQYIAQPEDGNYLLRHRIDGPGFKWMSVAPRGPMDAGATLKNHNEPPLLEFVGDTPRNQLKYVPNLSHNVVVLSHSIKMSENEWYKYIGQWSPER